MKHQLYKKGTYVEVNIGSSHMTVVGKVKNSEIVNKMIRAETTFNFPQESLELEPKLLLIPENPEVSPVLYDDMYFIKDSIHNFNGITAEEGALYAGIYDLSTPGKELKELFYKLNQGAK